MGLCAHRSLPTDFLERPSYLSGGCLTLGWAASPAPSLCVSASVRFPAARNLTFCFTVMAQPPGTPSTGLVGTL